MKQSFRFRAILLQMKKRQVSDMGWFGDACDWIGDHVSKAWDAADECLSDAGKCFKSGNILGGIGNGFAGLATGLFGTATGGLTVAAGDAVASTGVGESLVETLGDYKLGEDERNEKCAKGWKDVQEYWSLAGDRFKNGNIMGGIHKGLMGVLGNAGNCLTLGQAGRWGQSLVDRINNGEDVGTAGRLLDTIAQGSASSEITQEALEANGHVGKANLLGGLDLGKDAAFAAGAAGLLHGMTGAVTASTMGEAFSGVSHGMASAAMGTMGGMAIGMAAAPDAVEQDRQLPDAVDPKHVLGRQLPDAADSQSVSGETDAEMEVGE